MIYYIADTHFGDERIMKLAKRPFATTIEMDEYIVKKWNNRVLKRDTVYIVGDFAFNEKTAIIVNRLNGLKHLVIGNHDNVLDKTLSLFESVDKIMTINDDGRSVCLCHYPLLSYENSVYGGYQVFGHIHNNPNDIASKLQNELNNSLNCGVDVTDFEPKTLDELIEMKKEKKI